MSGFQRKSMNMTQGMELRSTSFSCVWAHGLLSLLSSTGPRPPGCWSFFPSACPLLSCHLPSSPPAHHSPSHAGTAPSFSGGLVASSSLWPLSFLGSFSVHLIHLTCGLHDCLFRQLFLLTFSKWGFQLAWNYCDAASVKDASIWVINLIDI